MSNYLALRAAAETVRTAAFGSITGSLTALGTAYLHPVRIYSFTNGTDAVINVSWDGANINFSILPGNSLVLDICANQSNPDGLYMAKGGTTYISYATAPTSGSVYLSLIYGQIN